MEKAEHNLKTVLFMVESGFSDWAVNAAFYSMYQCMLSIIAKFGYESQNQTCTIALVEWLNEEGKIGLDKKFIKLLQPEEDFSIINMREDYTYGFKIAVPDDDIKKVIGNCKGLLERTKVIIYG